MIPFFTHKNINKLNILFYSFITILVLSSCTFANTKNSLQANTYIWGISSNELKNNSNRVFTEKKLKNNTIALVGNMKIDGILFKTSYMFAHNKLYQIKYISYTDLVKDKGYQKKMLNTYNTIKVSLSQRLGPPAIDDKLIYNPFEDKNIINKYKKDKQALKGIEDGTVKIVSEWNTKMALIALITDKSSTIHMIKNIIIFVTKDKSILDEVKQPLTLPYTT